jgi:DNA-binding MarR family transcriptional regulator
VQDYDALSALTGVGDQRRCAKDLATHLLWSPSRLSHHVNRIQRPDQLIRREGGPEGRGMDFVLPPEGLAATQAAAPGHVAVRETFRLRHGRWAFVDRIPLTWST